MSYIRMETAQTICADEADGLLLEPVDIIVLLKKVYGPFYFYAIQRQIFMEKIYELITDYLGYILGSLEAFPCSGKQTFKTKILQQCRRLIARQATKKHWNWK